MITGGLGGLGVLATYELAAAGAPYVVTTSRSGRIGGGQRELVQMQENFRQMTTHYSAKIDGTDAGAMSDLFHWIQRPDNMSEDLDVFDACINALDRNLGEMSVAELAKLESTKAHITETCALLEKEILAKRATSREEWLLRETRKKEKRIDEVIAKAGGGTTKALGQQEPVPQPAAKMSLREYLAKQQAAAGEAGGETVLDKVEQEVAAARDASN
mmetsp:Transcript_71863/g.99558  ORF Transcript_71863/g.99558 Transcript_71863/m.99558 type:complete len:216 (-) Transcript_71863:17-664(-)